MKRRHITVIAAALVGFLALCAIGASCEQKAAYPEPPRRGTDLFIAESLLKTDVPAFFSFSKDRMKVRFFVLRTDEGIFAFLDACETCTPRKLGYTFEEGRLVCRACNQQFVPSEVARGFGGCYPIRVPGRAAEGGYLVPVSGLMGHAGKF